MTICKLAYPELKNKILLTGIAGVWKDCGDEKHFNTPNGEILKYRPSTNTITLCNGTFETATLLAPALL